LEDFIMTRKTLLPLSALLLLLATLPGLAQKKPVKPAADTAPKITTPKEQLGFNLGDDYQLATYTQLGEYWTKLAKESPRMKLVEIGKTEEGRPHWMAIVTSPENQKNLEHYREISYKLTARCTPPKWSAASSLWRWSTKWSAAPIPRPCASSTM
jgi:hypothetical protein